MDIPAIISIIGIILLLVGGVWLFGKGYLSVQKGSKASSPHPVRTKLLGSLAVLLAGVMLCTGVGLIPSMMYDMLNAADLRRGMTATSLAMTADSIAMTATSEYARLHPTLTPTPTRTPMRITSKDYCYASFNSAPIILRGVFEIPPVFFCYKTCGLWFILEETGVRVGVSIPRSKLVAFTRRDTKFYLDDGQTVGLGELVILRGVVVYEETFEELTPTPEVDCHLSISSITIP